MTTFLTDVKKFTESSKSAFPQWAISSMISLKFNLDVTFSIITFCFFVMLSFLLAKSLFQFPTFVKWHVGLSLRPGGTTTHTGLWCGDWVTRAATHRQTVKEARRRVTDRNGHRDWAVIRGLGSWWYFTHSLTANRGFPRGPVAKTPHSQCREPRCDPWSAN